LWTGNFFLLSFLISVWIWRAGAIDMGIGFRPVPLWRDSMASTAFLWLQAIS
jgi:hypothetical protein